MGFGPFGFYKAVEENCWFLDALGGLGGTSPSHRFPEAWWGVLLKQGIIGCGCSGALEKHSKEKFRHTVYTTDVRQEGSTETWEHDGHQLNSLRH